MDFGSRRRSNNKNDAHVVGHAPLRRIVPDALIVTPVAEINTDHASSGTSTLAGMLGMEKQENCTNAKPI
ncbi:hypothetical protein LY78DRAFT_289169 [Colletotrichum sublineola]|nr:hypothetical protein LY78DRAFT_289169 [Colletotrichum sublineola]